MFAYYRRQACNMYQRRPWRIWVTSSRKPSTLFTDNCRVLQLLQSQYALVVDPLVHLRCGVLPHHLALNLWRLVVPLADITLMPIGCAAVTTHYANCTQCAPGYYQGFDSQKLGQCSPCFTGYYGAGE